MSSRTIDGGIAAFLTAGTTVKYAAIGLALVIAAYLFIAYVIAPALWLGYAHRHPALDATPGITLTSDDHPGDPINVALIGSADDLKALMQAAGWFSADPLGLRSDVKIAADTVLKRPYDKAPVSNLFLFGRKEDLAFERPVGNDPKQRHHVRFWKADQVDDQGRPLWVGSATYDERVGLSHTTGQVTHHISANVDAERDFLFDTLHRAERLADVRFVDDFHPVRAGRNGGGDPWHTDGRLLVGTMENGAIR
jgi:LssY-like putative type I secretion system component LssY